MQEFEDLKTDIANLITTTSQTVNALVTAAQSRIAAATTSSPPADVATYASQMTQLSSQIKSAMSSMQASAAVILGTGTGGTPAQSGGGAPLGIGSVSSGGTSSSISGTTSAPPSTSPVSSAAADPNASPTTVGPDSFKAAN